MKKFFFNMFRKIKGQGMVEYGLIIALIAIVVITAIGYIGGNLNSVFNSIANKLTPGP